MAETASTASAPKTGERHLGALCWNELHTRDTAKAAAFYTSLIGWKAQACPPAGETAYTEWITKSGNVVGGLMKLPDGVPAQVPGSWAIYINVADVDASVKKAVSLGGKQIAPPFDVPKVGRIAAVADPTGAVIHLFKGVESCGMRGPQMEHGTFCWAELLTTDPAAAERFLTQLFGWTVTKMPFSHGEYTMFWRPGADPAKKTGCIGGMMKIIPEMGPIPSNWLTYIQVDDVDATAGRIPSLGGKVCAPPTDIPGIGRYAVATDPTGVVFALFTSKS